MTLGTVVGALGKGVLARVLPPMKGSRTWAKWIEDVVAEGPLDMFPTLKALSSRMKHHIAGMVAPEFFRMGYSANKYLELMKSAGLGIRRQAALKSFKGAVEIVTKTRGLMDLNPDIIPGPDLWLHAKDLMPANFRNVIKIGVYDDSGTFIKHSFRSIYLNRQISPRDLSRQLDNFLTIVGSPVKGHRIELVGIERIYASETEFAKYRPPVVGI